jgi:transposase
MRDSLVSARTKVINTVRGWLRGQGRRLGKGSSPTFGKRVRALFGAELPDYVERQLRVVEALTGRFATAHQVESYLGLVPGENSSSDRQQRLSITKAGPTALRWVLVQAAWALKRTRRQPAAIPLQLWAHQVELRRGKRIAMVALARKLAGILYAIWRDGTEYDGSRGAKMI